MEELGNVKINLNFLDGPSLGIGKNKCKLEAVFVNSKPLSFTTKLEF